MADVSVSFMCLAEWNLQQPATSFPSLLRPLSTCPEPPCFIQNISGSYSHQPPFTRSRSQSAHLTRVIERVSLTNLQLTSLKTSKARYHSCLMLTVTINRLRSEHTCLYCNSGSPLIKLHMVRTGVKVKKIRNIRREIATSGTCAVDSRFPADNTLMAQDLAGHGVLQETCLINLVRMSEPPS